MRRALWIALIPALVNCGGAVQTFKDESEKWRSESQSWQKKFESLQSEVEKFRETLPKVADAVDPIAVKEMYRDTKSLTQANAELQAVLSGLASREMAGSYRVTASTNSPNDRVEFDVDLYRVDVGNASACPTTVDSTKLTKIRNLASIAARTAQPPVSYVQGRDVGPGCYLIRRGEIRVLGFADESHNILDIRFQIERRTNEKGAEWKTIVTQSLQGQDDQVRASGKLATSDTLIGVRVE